MTWRDNLQEASFRDIKFHVLSHEYSVGRRNVVHQYPFKDDPYIEDLGLDADEFTIEGYILANIDNEYDYFTQRNNLISALKQSGPGTLVHPYLGAKYVNLSGKARIREVFNEGGIARFTMSFVVAGEAKFPKENIDPSGAVDSAAEDLINITLDSFYDQYTMEDAPRFVHQGMLDDFDSFVSMAKNKVNSMRSSAGSSISSVKSVMDDARETMIEAVRYPCQVGGLVFDCVDSILETANIVGSGYLGQILGQCSGQILSTRVSSIGDKITEELGRSIIVSMTGVIGKTNYDGFGSAYDQSINSVGSMSSIIVSTETTARQASNRLAFINMVKSMYLAGVVRIAIRIEYRNMDQVIDARNSIVECMDYFLKKLGDESASDPYKDYGIYIDNRNIYSEVEDLRSVFLKGMKDKFINTPHEIEIDIPADGLTSLHIAYDKYDDLSREDEIFKRNQSTIKHPGFINENIKILSQ